MARTCPSRAELRRCAPRSALLRKKRWSARDCSLASRLVRRCAAAPGLGRAMLVATPQAEYRMRTTHPGAQLKHLPLHIQPFGQFMRQMAAEPLTSRRIIKAYLITRSSVRRSAVKKPTVCKVFPGYGPLPRLSDPARVRPEDAMARLLFTDAGRQYLNDAEQGRFNKRAARQLVAYMSCYGFKDVLLSDMKRAVQLGKKREAVATALNGPPKTWWTFVRRNVHGIGAGKAGFIAALLGRGDIPTFDAREKQLWLKKPKPSFDPTWKDVEQLRNRFLNYPMTVPAELEPFKVHLVHHALWDAYGGTKTTHGAPIRSMQFAGRGLDGTKEHHWSETKEAGQYALEAAMRAQKRADQGDCEGALFANEEASFWVGQAEAHGFEVDPLEMNDVLRESVNEAKRVRGETVVLCSADLPSSGALEIDARLFRDDLDDVEVPTPDMTCDDLSAKTADSLRRIYNYQRYAQLLRKAQHPSADDANRTVSAMWSRYAEVYPRFRDDCLYKKPKPGRKRR